MGLKRTLHQWKNNYVIRQVEDLPLPEFKPSPEERRKLVFHGKVQKVGFRLEVFELAKKLGLSGWVTNREDGSVEAQIQGEEHRIRFLVDFMCSLKRAKVKKVESVPMPLEDESASFVIAEKNVEYTK